MSAESDDKVTHDQEDEKRPGRLNSKGQNSRFGSRSGVRYGSGFLSSIDVTTMGYCTTHDFLIAPEPAIRAESFFMIELVGSLQISPKNP
jgi:hypothetical protein